MSCAERHRFQPQPRLDQYHLPCTASVDSLILSNSHSHRVLIYGVGQNKKQDIQLKTVLFVFLLAAMKTTSYLNKQMNCQTRKPICFSLTGVIFSCGDLTLIFTPYPLVLFIISDILSHDLVFTV